MTSDIDILVVDDEPIVRSMIGYPLEQLGYRVHPASHGREALSILRQEPIRMVLSDWNMPEMDGIELCRTIRENSSSHYVYFIMVTCHHNPDDTLTGFEVGVDDFIRKPFQPAELLMRVKAGRRMIELETNDLTIFALAKLAESRDHETGEHIERVRDFCRVLASRLRGQERFAGTIDDDFVRMICATSPLHDIGKVAIPDSILLKPGKLTAAEFEIMKTHTVRGAETLASAISAFPNAGFLKMARDIALSHHERFDGKGYPFGMAGESIPLAARILSVADVFDALTSKRVYKDAYDEDDAIRIIASGRGSQFDPFVVDAFLADTDELVAIKRRYCGRMDTTVPRDS